MCEIAYQNKDITSKLFADKVINEENMDMIRRFHIVKDTNQQSTLTKIPAISKELINTTIMEVYDNERTKAKNHREWN